MPSPQDNRSEISGAEVILLALLITLGMALWVWVERGFAWFCDCEPNQARLLEKSGITDQQYQLTWLQEQKKAGETQLTAVQLDKLTQEATLSTLETLYPNISKPAANPSTIFADTQKTYEAAKNQSAIDAKLIESLTARIEQFKKDTKTAAAALEPRTDAFMRDYQKFYAEYVLVKTAVAFVAPVVVVLIVLWLLRKMLPHSKERRVWTTRGRVPYLIVGSLLTILLAYQALPLAGALAIGTILFLFLLWRIRWSTKVGEVPVVQTPE